MFKNIQTFWRVWKTCGTKESQDLKHLSYYWIDHMHEQSMDCEEEMPNAHTILNVKGTDLPSDIKLIWDNRDV